MAGKHILVPVDGSSHSRRAAEYAIQVARCMNKEILLVHFHKHFPTLIGEPYHRPAISKILSQSNEFLEPFRQLITQAGINFEERILEGPAGDRICEVARIEECEMIVMGCRGLTKIQGLILGSVAHRVLHSATCPVLVVK